MSSRGEIAVSGPPFAFTEDNLAEAHRHIAKYPEGRQASALLGQTPRLCMHGGGAQVLRPRLPAHDWVPDAVLQGLARWHALRIA